jgi:hypothetical protein
MAVSTGDQESFAEYMARTGGKTGGGMSSTGGSDDDGLGPNYGLTGNSQPGLRSPDAIDSPRNVLNITTSVGVSAMPPEELAQIQAMLRRAGYTTEGYTPTGTLDDETVKGLQELKRTASATGMSDLDTLRQTLETRAQAEAGAYGADLAGGSSGGAAVDNSPQVSVNKTITEPVLTDPMTIRAMFRATLEERLGRAPTADEYQKARKMIQNSEGGQDVTTTRSVTRPGETANDSRTTTRVTRSDNTTDPSPDVLLDDMSRRGKLGREANTVTAASLFDVLANRVGMG